MVKYGNVFRRFFALCFLASTRSQYDDVNQRPYNVFRTSCTGWDAILQMRYNMSALFFQVRTAYEDGYIYKTNQTVFTHIDINHIWYIPLCFVIYFRFCLENMLTQHRRVSEVYLECCSRGCFSCFSQTFPDSTQYFSIFHHKNIITRGLEHPQLPLRYASAVWPYSGN